MIVVAAAEAGVELLLTEDLHDGFMWRGVTVTNPFRQLPDTRITPLLATK
jgi:predicted nucleic acid-binding protein